MVQSVQQTSPGPKKQMKKQLMAYTYHWFPLKRPYWTHMDVSENRGTPESSILIGFSIINHPFWGTLFLETPIFLRGGFVKGGVIPWPANKRWRWNEWQIDFLSKSHVDLVVFQESTAKPKNPRDTNGILDGNMLKAHFTMGKWLLFLSLPTFSWCLWCLCR